MQSERRLIDKSKPASADSGYLRGHYAIDRKGLLLPETHQHSALGNVGRLTTRHSRAQLNVNIKFARQPFVLTPIAHFRKPEENHASSLKSLRQPREFLARVIDDFSVPCRAHCCLFYFGNTIRDCAD